MEARQLLALGATMLAMASAPAFAQDSKEPYVRVAEIEIDPLQLDAYKAAVKEQIEAAVRLEPGCVPLLVEAAEHLLATDRAGECIALIDQAPAEVRRRGRVGLQRCRALLAVGRIEEARAVLDGELEVADLREGETLGSLWRQAYAERPLPRRYDFGMQPG